MHKIYGEFIELISYHNVCIYVTYLTNRSHRNYIVLLSREINLRGLIFALKNAAVRSNLRFIIM